MAQETLHYVSCFHIAYNQEAQVFKHLQEHFRDMIANYGLLGQPSVIGVEF